MMKTQSLDHEGEDAAFLKELHADAARHIDELKRQAVWQHLNPLERHKSLIIHNWKWDLEWLIASKDHASDVAAILAPLKEAALNGTLSAVNLLALLAVESVVALNKLARKYPDYVGIVAKHFPLWTVLSAPTRVSEQDLSLIRKLGIPKADSWGVSHVNRLIRWDSRMVTRHLTLGRLWAVFLHATLQDCRGPAEDKMRPFGLRISGFEKGDYDPGILFRLIVGDAAAELYRPAATVCSKGRQQTPGIRSDSCEDGVVAASGETVP